MGEAANDVERDVWTVRPAAARGRPVKAPPSQAWRRRESVTALRAFVAFGVFCVVLVLVGQWAAPSGGSTVWILHSSVTGGYLALAAAYTFLVGPVIDRRTVHRGWAINGGAHAVAIAVTLPLLAVVTFSAASFLFHDAAHLVRTVALAVPVGLGILVGYAVASTTAGSFPRQAPRAGGDQTDWV